MSRLNVAYTVLSKRKLLKLVNNKFVRGWDDPRMPTIKVKLHKLGIKYLRLINICIDYSGIKKARIYPENNQCFLQGCGSD
jgi:glutaminyl-tRNA synthetase